jgi:hypothetical protein
VPYTTSVSPSGGADTAQEGVVLPVVATEPNTPDAFIVLGQVRDDRPRSVGAGILDEHDLVRVAKGAECGG